MKPIKNALPLVAAVAAACSTPATPEPTTAPARSCGCEPTCCSTEAQPPVSTKEVLVELLYLDLSTCTRCRGTDAVLDEALSDLAPVAEARGATVRLKKVHVETEEQARAVGFQSSPTIRVNGRDIAGPLRESGCDDCGELCGCGSDVRCRVWAWEGKESTTPPKALVVDAIVRELYGISSAPVAEAPRDVPENLKRFFVARSKH